MISRLVDVSRSPHWVDVFAKEGWPATHWTTIGEPQAKDRIVMAWAREHSHVVFTNDLDFGTLLALTSASGPSVIQIRAHDVLPQHLGHTVVATIRAYESHLKKGAIVTIDELRGKVRLLPIAAANMKRE